MGKKNKNKVALIARFFDYPICLLAIVFCGLASLSALPWIYKQRRAWQNSVKGSPRALILRGFTVGKVKERGFWYLLPFQNPHLRWIGIMDPANTVETKIKVDENFFLIARKSPNFVKIIEKLGLGATSIIFREAIGVVKVTIFCVREEIGVLRVYGHNYQALQACLVSALINIPFVIDICANYELIYRLTGKTFYFKTLNKIPIIKKMAHIASNRLLSFPMRRAFRIFGRNKNNYEHAFALGAPVDRLSLLRISNFNAAFNSFNPEKPPPRQADYPYILFVGRLAKINFPLDVIDAFNIAASQLPDHRLVIIGDGAIRPEVEKRIEQSAHFDRIVFLGRCPSDIVLNWTAHASVALCPYSGSTLVEAMLCGIPVIAYDVEWHAEIVIGDYTGFLVPFGDIAALAAKIVHVMAHYEEAKKIAGRGRNLAHVVFDKERISETESITYSQALSAD
jgi:glycosyltransferase involved in cell wall biosynthesis